ncbi:hypothetical protein EXIGLDRAFT_649638 [Exidia glandulosa HHB12029]|uniref:RBR-type E3 ubiquitin transferase n=1 Tax=Exidia glandulosa HHB12029 TaxID=1314781 RepID=A0A165G7V4_EXIGL|nr:hypothetical protein EXIGLDRAFT_649638 [Exidia glandulosa HHB12029]
MLSPASSHILIDEEIEDKPGSTSNIECTACGSRIRGRSTRAPCNHAYDAACIADLFQASMTDESLFPPRCCGQEITLSSVRNLLRVELVQRFEAKAVELRTLRRVYCPNASCSRFLGAQTDADKPAGIVCPACHTTACSACTGAHAEGVTCAQNADAQPILELAREEGWQRCPGCKRFIELETGCYHMTCICRTHFCYVCAEIWKNCDCPQWEESRLLTAAHERVAHEVGRRRFQPEAAPQQARIFEVAEELRRNHECDHHSTRFLRGSHYQCQTCYWHADQYILECRDCYRRICRRCKHNRF